jgi:hypothetical protein
MHAEQYVRRLGEVIAVGKGAGGVGRGDMGPTSLPYLIFITQDFTLPLTTKSVANGLTPQLSMARVSM